MSNSIHVAVLQRAAEILGGKMELRTFLRVPMRQLDVWMKGDERPPAYVFLVAVDLITKEPETGAPDVVRKSIELRRKAALTGRAAQAARDNAASIIERSKAIRAALLEQGVPPAAPPRKVSAGEFAATEFTP